MFVLQSFEIAIPDLLQNFMDTAKEMDFTRLRIQLINRVVFPLYTHQTYRVNSKQIPCQQKNESTPDLWSNTNGFGLWTFVVEQ